MAAYGIGAQCALAIMALARWRDGDARDGAGGAARRRRVTARINRGVMAS